MNNKYNDLIKKCNIIYSILFAVIAVIIFLNITTENNNFSQRMILIGIFIDLLHALAIYLINRKMYSNKESVKLMFKNSFSLCKIYIIVELFSMIVIFLFNIINKIF